MLPIVATFFFPHSPETPTDLPQPASYAARMDDDRAAFEFAYALYQAQQVDQSSDRLRNWAQASYIDRPNSPSPTVWHRR